MISLNLLSPAQKANLRYDHAYLYLRYVVSVTLVATVVIAGILLGARLLLQSHYLELLTSSGLVNEHNRGVDREINDLNQKLKQAKAVQGDFVKWSNVLVGLAETIPPNVQVSYLNIEKNSHTLSLSGVAQTRDDYLKLKANLESLPYLSEVTAPFSSILRPTNVKFDLTAKLSPERLP
jgi:Tfp pilus assembly protein PilN